MDSGRIAGLQALPGPEKGENGEYREAKDRLSRGRQPGKPYKT